MSDDTKRPLQQTLDELKTLRDELRVKANLAGKDLQDFLDKQDVKIQELQHKVDAVADEAKAHAPEVKEAFWKLIKEVKGAFEDTRDRVTKG